MQPGYKSPINYTDTEYFNLSDKDTRIATAKRQKPVPTVEQTRHVIEVMPLVTYIDRRNHCLIAFIQLTVARDSAVASLKLKHIGLNACSVFQDAREVNTKFSKTFTTDFFPLGEDIRRILVGWVGYLKNELLYGNDDLLFPKTKVGQGDDNTFVPLGFQREHWSTTSPVRKTSRDAFEAGGLPYFNPHSFRNTLAALREKLCQPPEDFKAWSQNFGHDKVLTTFF